MFRRTLMTALAFSGAAYAQGPNATAPAEHAAPTQCPPTPCPLAPALGDRVAYAADFFAQFSPQTALDMVRQTPGFSLSGGDDERRGFSGAVGNLLIDGARPIAKSQSLESILDRIPAKQVMRIEVLRGAAVAGDASGQAVLLNVVRTPAAGSGVWSSGFEYNDDRFAPRGDASWSGRSGHTEYGFGASLFSQRRSLPGSRRVFAADRTPIAYVDAPSPRNYREGELSANIATPVLGGRLSANGSFDAWRFHALNGLFFYAPTNDPTETLTDNYSERQWSYEIGLNYDRDFGPWSLSLVGLANERDFSNDDWDVDADGAGGFLSSDVQHTERDARERILRSAFSRNFGAKHHIEFGIEGAINTLDASGRLVEDTGAGPHRVDIPNSNVSVEEKRAEAFVSYTWRPDDRWSLETRLAREASRLSFSGDANQAVELAFVKPSVQLARNIGVHNQLRVRAYRDVGQLDFDDFVSAASIVDDLIAGGNPDLKPQTDWRLELGADLRFPGDAALSLALTRHWISDAADVVQIVAPNPSQDPADPFDDVIRFDAPGNIGKGEALDLNIHLSLPLNWLLHGARLTLDGDVQHTEVTDPITHRLRKMSNAPDVNITGEFRQDIASRHFAWGVDLEKVSEQQVYRFNEIDTQEEGPWIDLFVESTAIQGVKLTAYAANIGRGDVRRQRFFFAPDRNGPLDHYEIRTREFTQAPWLVFQVSGSF